MKYTTKIIIILSVMLSIISCTYVKIEQDVSRNSVLNTTVCISTKIITYTWYGSFNTLEYSEYVDVEESEVDSVKKVEYEKAIPTFVKVKNISEGVVLY